MSEFNALIVYESMFGSTRRIAEAIAVGLAPAISTRLVRVANAPVTLDDVELLIVGAPTHVHGLSRPATRAEARNWVQRTDLDLTLEPDAAGVGIRDWLADLREVPRRIAVFDTRADLPGLFSGSAGNRIERTLRGKHAEPIVERTDFLVDKHSRLVDGELDRARDWGRAIAARMTAARTLR